MGKNIPIRQARGKIAATAMAMRSGRPWAMVLPKSAELGSYEDWTIQRLERIVSKVCFAAGTKQALGVLVEEFLAGREIADERETSQADGNGS